MQHLIKWWSEFPADLLLRRVVQPLQKYLTEELSTTKKLTVSVMNSIKVLAKVEEANQLGRQLPPEAFYNELIRSENLSWPIQFNKTCHCQQFPLLLHSCEKQKFVTSERRMPACGKCSGSDCGLCCSVQSGLFKSAASKCALIQTSNKSLTEKS